MLSFEPGPVVAFGVGEPAFNGSEPNERKA